ncbi:alpha/beta hydrolase [Intrasporangium chromatireducens Q5-1]|uniref:Alpha/beta hydrolase n=1 Tax=Intrasporangium chromatireducens Q5-1 TaxID=584657 RepID=W9GMR2_9MICO|nr:alpha/beta fold hydrolase [Intrasporangium chromatireducens]EWT07400.1 alpha/beta hydrolase [Intrasporangium chromatireducens Q5-1]
MLSDDPQPGDLPEAPEEPYAAVRRIAGGPPPPGAGSHDEPLAGVPEPVRPPVTQAGVPAPRPRPAWLNPVVAVVAVIALLAVVGLGVWAFRPVDLPPVAVPTSSPSATGSAPPTSGPPATTPAPASTDHPKVLDRFYTQSLSWSSCGDSSAQQCAKIKVPVDYAKPAGDTFTLALRKAPATDPSKRIGSLLINPGGPGGSGVQYAEYAAFVFSKDLRAAYDVVGFDPRGIGQSDAVACLTNQQMDLLFADDPTPDTAAERHKLLSDADVITKSCATSGGERARHMSSTEVAKDMDIIRALVGDEKLNYYGVSYGTFLGGLYADLFPKRVGRFVLDSAMSPNQTDLQQTQYDIQGFESSMDAFIAWCVKRDDCALGRDPKAAAGKIVDLIDHIDQHPLRTTKGGLTSIGEGWVNFAIFMCLYSNTSWPTLNRGLAQAIEKGTGDILLTYASQVVERDAKGNFADSSYLQAMIPVRCADWPRTPETPARQAEQRKLQAAHPLWARMTGELYDNCKAWPAPGRQPTGTTIGKGAAPILVIGNLRDPATPIGGTRQLAKDLASGVLVTSNNDGHGTYLSGNSCIDRVVDGYLVAGTVPPNGKAC